MRREQRIALFFNSPASLPPTEVWSPELNTSWLLPGIDQAALPDAADGRATEGGLPSQTVPVAAASSPPVAAGCGHPEPSCSEVRTAESLPLIHPLGVDISRPANSPSDHTDGDGPGETAALVTKGESKGQASGVASVTSDLQAQKSPQHHHRDPRTSLKIESGAINRVSRQEDLWQQQRHLMRQSPDPAAGRSLSDKTMSPSHPKNLRQEALSLIGKVEAFVS